MRFRTYKNTDLTVSEVGFGYAVNESAYVEISGGELPTYRRCSLIHVGSRRQSTIARINAVCSETEWYSAKGNRVASAR